MAKCDTCALLAVPDNPDHAKHYRVCTWQPAEPMPANVLHLERAALKREVARWITTKIVNEKPEMMADCPCWRPHEQQEKGGD